MKLGVGYAVRTSLQSAALENQKVRTAYPTGVA
jgi:hypothetical protein